MRTGLTQGPRAHRLIKSDFEPLELDLTLENAVIASIRSATWLEDADLGAAQQAVLLAQTMDQMPDRRHQLAPILIGLFTVTEIIVEILTPVTSVPFTVTE